MSNKLVNRTINTAEHEELKDNWYAPLEYFRQFPSVVKVSHFDTMSSAGDWQGYIVQKIGKTSYLIPFSQENNYPRSGFTAYTGDILASCIGDFTEDEINQILEDALQFA